MKLLIVTQKVNKNDDILGFFHGWLLEFAKNYEKVTVICLEKGEYDFPENVKILSLGKETRENGRETSAGGSLPSIFARLHYIKNFYKYIWQERNNYDKVFVHMNPIYIVLGGLFWRLRGNKIALWYTHRNVDLKLKIAEKLTDVIFSASQESFQMKTNKLKVVGHGVDANKLNCKNFVGEKEFDIVCVGRVSPIKNQKILVEAVNILVNEKKLKDLKVAIVGGGMLEKDNIYFKEIKKFVEENNLQNNIIFTGSVSNEKISSYYCQSKISVNLCPTGGMDKVVLEAMLSEIPAIALNKTFESMLGDKGLVLKNLDKKELADKISEWLEKTGEERKQIGVLLRNIVIENHSLSGFVKKIKESFKIIKIGIITPIWKTDYLVDTVLDGLFRLSKEKNIEFFISSNYRSRLPYRIKSLSQNKFIKFSKQADLIFFTYGKDNTNYKLAEKINEWQKTIFIDGSELGKNRRLDENIVESVLNGSYEFQGKIDSEILEKSSMYFKREKPYVKGVKPFPYGIVKKYISWNKKIKKDIDFTCIFGQEDYPPLRREVRQELERYCNENNFKCVTKKTRTPKKFYELLARTKVGISVSGGGYDTARFWEILANNCILLTEKIDLFKNKDRKLDYKNIIEFEGLEDFKKELEKLGHHLKKDYNQDESLGDYYEILKNHSSKARVEFILEEVKQKGL